MLDKKEEKSFLNQTMDQSSAMEMANEKKTENLIEDLAETAKELKEKVKDYQDLRLDHTHDLKKKEMDQYQHQVEEKRLVLGRKMRQFKFALSKVKNQENLKNFQEGLFKEIYELFYIQDETNSFYEQMFVYFIGEHNDSKNTIMNLFNEIEEKIQKIQNEREFFKTQFLSQRGFSSEQKLQTDSDQKDPNIQDQDSQNKLIIKENQQMKNIIDHKERLIKQLKKQIQNKNYHNYESKLDQLNEKVKYVSLFASFKNKEKLFQEKIEQIQKEIQNNMKVDKAEEINRNLDQLKFTSIFTRFKQQRLQKKHHLYKDQKIHTTSLKLKISKDIQQISKLKNQLKLINKKIKQNNALILNYNSETKMLKTLLNQISDVPKIYKMIDEVKQKEKIIVQDNEDMTKQSEKVLKALRKNQKSLGNFYVKNLQEIKKLNSYSRIHLTKTSKIKKYLQRKMKEIEKNCLFQLIDQGQTEDIYEHYKDLKFIHHCLDKQVTNDIGLPKLIQKKKKIKKKNETKKFNDDFRKKIDELKKNANKEIKQLREMVGQKEETMKRISTVINQMKKINEELDNDLDEQELLNQNLIKEKLNIQLLEQQQKYNQESLAQYEKKLQLEIQNNQQKDQEIQKLNEFIENQKRILKDIQKQKKQSQKQIDESEQLIKEKNQKIKQIKDQLEKLRTINEQLKKNLNLQYQKIQKLIEESKNKFVLLEDLTKKDKIFHQLFDIQDKKIQTKDKKIQGLQSKLVNHQNLIEALLKDKIEGNKGLSDHLAKNLPSHIKKEEKQMEKLQRDFSKATQEIVSLKKKLDAAKNKNKNLRISLIQQPPKKKAVKTKTITKKNKVKEKQEKVSNNKVNKNYAKKVSLKKSFTGKTNLNSNFENSKQLQQNETLKNINRISSKKSLQESCLTLSLDNNEEEDFSSIENKKKIQENKSQQVNFVVIPQKAKNYYEYRILKLKDLYLQHTYQIQTKLNQLKVKAETVQVLKIQFLQQKMENEKLYISQNKKIENCLSNHQKNNSQLLLKILKIVNDKNNNKTEQLQNLLNNYYIEQKQTTEQNFEEKCQQSQQQNLENPLSDDEQEYQDLKNQIKGKKRETIEALKDKKQDVFSFNQKLEKKNQSVYDPNAKNVFMDDTMNQSSFCQNRQKMDKKELQQIEEDSDLFEKEHSASEEDDDVDVDFFNNRNKNDIMDFEPSKEESIIENKIQMEQKEIDQNEVAKKEVVESVKNIKEDLLHDFDNGNMFSFTKGFKIFVMAFYNNYMKQIFIEFVIQKLLEIQDKDTNTDQNFSYFDTILQILNQNQLCLQTVKIGLKNNQKLNPPQSNLSLASQQKTYYQKKFNLYENFRKKMIKIYNQFTDEYLDQSSTLKQIFTAYRDHLELMCNLNQIIKQNKTIKQIVKNCSEKTSQEVPQQFSKKDSMMSNIEFPKSSQKQESLDRKLQRKLSVQKVNELDPYRKYSQLTNKILKATMDENQYGDVNQVIYRDDKSCPGDRSRENFFFPFNQIKNQLHEFKFEIYLKQ